MNKFTRKFEFENRKMLLCTAELVLMRKTCMLWYEDPTTGCIANDGRIVNFSLSVVCTRLDFMFMFFKQGNPSAVRFYSNHFHNSCK